VVHNIGINGSWRWIISNLSRSRTALILEDSQGERVTRAMEPLVGIGRGLPIEINLSPKLEITLDAGAMTLTS
jgi:hypothetical protein